MQESRRIDGASNDATRGREKKLHGDTINSFTKEPGRASSRGKKGRPPLCASHLFNEAVLYGETPPGLFHFQREFMTMPLPTE